MLSKSLFIVLTLFISFNFGFSQRAPIAWTLKADRVNQSEWLVTITAAIAPGFHIYSQNIEEGGPIATRIRFDSSDHCITLGKAVEKGPAQVYYDSLYEMKVTWYAGQVSFLQRLLFKGNVQEIRGTIEYILCDTSQCIPLLEPFKINIQPHP